MWVYGMLVRLKTTDRVLLGVVFFGGGLGDFFETWRSGKLFYPGPRSAVGRNEDDGI